MPPGMGTGIFCHRCRYCESSARHSADRPYRIRTCASQRPAVGRSLFWRHTRTRIRFHARFRTGILPPGHSLTDPSQRSGTCPVRMRPIFEELNLAVDHNTLLDGRDDRVGQSAITWLYAPRKPFAGINGSGKHNN